MMTEESSQKLSSQQILSKGKKTMASCRLYGVVLILVGFVIFLSGAQPIPPPGMTAELVVETFPVYQKGSLAEPQIATVKLSLRGDFFTFQPLEVIIGVDRAVHLDEARPFLDRLLNLLGPDDRVGLVSVAPATLDSPLTSDFNLLRLRFSELTPGGSGGLADALALGTKELTETGRPEARRLQIWLVARAGLDRADFGPVLTQAQRARENQVAVHVIVTTDEAARSTTLLSLARLSSGIFARNLTDESLALLQNQVRYEFIARQIIAKVTLTARVTFEGAEAAPEIQEFTDGSRMLTWRLDALRPEEVAEFRFQVSSSTKGSFPINRSPSTVEYTNILGQRVRLNLPLITLDVTNASPVAKFEFNPESVDIDRATWQPVVNETIMFTDQSSDADGFIAKWAWDFGDGTTSTEQNPSHRYAQPGEYLARLTVTDNEDATSSIDQAIKVVNIVQATRKLPTFDGKLPRGIKIRIQLQIQVMRDILGLGVKDTWLRGAEGSPTNWVVRDVTEEVFHESHGGSFKASAAEWIFPDRLPAGTTKKIAYEVEIPLKVTNPETAAEEPPTLATYRIEGSVLSKVPDLQARTDGPSEFELIDGLSILVAVAHYVELNGEDRVDPEDGNGDKKIDHGEALRAIAWWLEDQPVPGTGEKKIDLATMQEIIAYWLSDTPVDQSLPPKP
jgi:PKD repeat protein